jgi:methylmalonyl-CoA mutase
METGYQRSKIQEESMYYEMLKHTGELPIVGVNTFRRRRRHVANASTCSPRRRNPSSTG